MNEIVSTIHGDLLDAGKAAATSAVSSRIDSLSDTLHDRAETFRNPEAAVAGAGEAVGQASETVAGCGSVGRLRRRRPAEDEEAAEHDSEERRNGRSRRPGRAGRKPVGQGRVRVESKSYEADEANEADEPETGYGTRSRTRRRRKSRPVDDVDEDGPRPRPRSPRRGAGELTSPVTRTRR